MDLLPEDHASLLQDLDQDPEAIFAQGLRKKENQALSTYNNGGAINVQSISNFDRRKAELEAGYKRTDKVIEKEQQIVEAAQTAGKVAEEFIIAPGADALTGGMYSNVKTAVKVSENLKNKQYGTALINASSLGYTTTEPLPKRSEYKSIQADIAGK